MTKEEATKVYNDVSSSYAKILYHDGQVAEHYGGDQWWKKCADQAHDNFADTKSVYKNIIIDFNESSGHVTISQDGKVLKDEHYKEMDGNTKGQASMYFSFNQIGDWARI